MEDKFEVCDGIFLSVSEYRGQKRVDIRKWYEEKNTGEMKPTTKGINMTMEQWEDFGAKFNEIMEYVEKNRD